MSEQHLPIGESFPLQYAWRLPDGSYLRAVFRANVLDLVPSADKYIVRLVELMAGREETPEGEAKPIEDLSREYWELVGALVGRRLTVAYEASDGRALYMRLETLTGEHNYFSRFDDASVVARGLEAQRRRQESGENATPEIGLE